MNNTDHNNAIAIWWVVGVFAALSLWFAFGSSALQVDIPEKAEVDKARLTSTPRRQMQSNPPVSVINSFPRDCMDCHKLFKSNDTPKLRLTQHLNVKLEHGQNTLCLGCHDLNDRNKLSSWDGEIIDFDKSEQLCSKCHGPTFRDWEVGVHGRATGSWQIDSPKRRTLSCVECHDPHHPAYTPIAPMPGPRTLHMGPQSKTHERDVKSPLMRQSGGHQ